MIEQSEFSREITAIIITALVGLFPILLTTILSRLEKRGLSAKQDRAIDLARKRVEFLEAWVKAQTALSSTELSEKIKGDVSTELDQLIENLSARLAEEEKRAGEEDERNILQVSFLAYRPGNFAGWVLRGLFYLFLIGTLFAFLVIIPDVGLDPDTGVFSWEQLVIDLFLIGAIFVLPLIFIRWLAVTTDRSAAEKKQPEE
jgi:hypothetical protein